jgi:hypothetical protein
MNSHRGIEARMVRSRGWIILALASSIAFTSAVPCLAQESPPDIDMLLNLDLFKQRTAMKNEGQNQGQNQGKVQDASMIEQLQTLEKMGLIDSESDTDTAPIRARRSRDEEDDESR